MPQIVSGHLDEFLHVSSLRQQAILAQQVLEDYEFDTIAFRGMSGALIAPILALNLQKELILVRKPADDSHSWFKVEGNKDAQRYVIVDDFESSGKTKRTIIEAVRTFAPDANYLGFLGCAYLSAFAVGDMKLQGKPYPLS